jgi:hypothetical protein
MSEVSLAEYLFSVSVKESFVTGLQVVRIPARARDVPLLQNAQNGHGAHTAFFFRYRCQNGRREAYHLSTVNITPNYRLFLLLCTYVVRQESNETGAIFSFM